MTAISDAEYIVIGGGAVGLGVAYALATTGRTDILLLERAPEVGAETTSQGAGLCGQVRNSADRIRLAMHSVRVFRDLQRSAVKPDWHETGSIRIALSDARAREFDELKRAADTAQLATELLDRPAAKKLWPLMNFEQARAILWCPTDGWMTPRAVAQSYAQACRDHGVRIATSTRLTGLQIRNDRVEGVQTDRGDARCRIVINAAGAHAYHVAQLAGLELPIVPVRHEYYITAAMDGLDPNLPCFRIPELTLYGRVRDGGLLLGGWEPKALNLDPREFALGQSPPPVQPDQAVLDHFEASLRPLFPGCAGAVRNVVGKGWPTFTPDGRFIIGASSRRPGFVMAGGCNAHGISGSGGIGQLLIEALFERAPSPYVKSLSPDRFTESKWDWKEARRAAARVYETYYGV